MRLCNIVNFDSALQAELYEGASASGSACSRDYIFWYLASPVIVSEVLKPGVWRHGVEVFLSSDSMVLRHFGGSC